MSQALSICLSIECFCQLWGTSTYERITVQYGIDGSVDRYRVTILVSASSAISLAQKGTEGQRTA